MSGVAGRLSRVECRATKEVDKHQQGVVAERVLCRKYANPVDCKGWGEHDVGKGKTAVQQH